MNLEFGMRKSEKGQKTEGRRQKREFGSGNAEVGKRAIDSTITIN